MIVINKMNSKSRKTMSKPNLKERIKKGLNQGVEKVRKGVAKVQAFRKSPKGQLLEQTVKDLTLHFLKQSGAGNKINDNLHGKLSPYTQGVGPLDDTRRLIHASIDQYFKNREYLNGPSFDYKSSSLNMTPINTIKSSPRNPPRYTPKRR